MEMGQERWIRLIAAGFLSVHILPERATGIAPVSSAILSDIFSPAIVTMFMPIASPVENSSLTNTLVPVIYVVALVRLP